MCPLQVNTLLEDYPNALARATNFDKNMTLTAFSVTPEDSDYGNILALSIRQMFGNIELTSGFNGTTYDPNDIMAFLRGT